MDLQTIQYIAAVVIAIIAFAYHYGKSRGELKQIHEQVDFLKEIMFQDYARVETEEEEFEED